MQNNSVFASKMLIHAQSESKRLSLQEFSALAFSVFIWQVIHCLNTHITATPLLSLWGRVQQCIKKQNKQASRLFWLQDIHVKLCDWVLYSWPLHHRQKWGRLIRRRCFSFTGWTVLTLCASQQMLNQPTVCHKYSRSMLLGGKLIHSTFKVWHLWHFLVNKFPFFWLITDRHTLPWLTKIQKTWRLIFLTMQK